MTKSMKAVRDRKKDNRRISQNMEKAFKKMAQVFGYPNREYKDRVFRMLLKEPKVALEVYNAMNGTSYDNPDELIITTLENAVYLGMKNDVSFILGTQLVLYEHQSTPNPNMPLRNLAYVACVYMAYVFGDNLYGRKLIKIPEPRFVVFYNGTDKMPEQSVLHLSDAYESKSEELDLELRIRFININPGYNEEMVEKSPTLYQYVKFVDTVRKYQKEMPFPEAVEKAIDECIKNGILAEFLRKNRAEVLRVSIFEYDEEEHMRQEREESRQEGIEQVNDLYDKLFELGRSEDVKRAVKDVKYREKLLEQCHFCPFTMISDERLLIASHIKPWAASNEKEKIDPNNGYILSPLYDKLFDKGYITFTINRHVILSEFISKYTWKQIGLQNNKFIKELPMNDKRINYLKFHHDSVFKGSYEFEK